MRLPIVLLLFMAVIFASQLKAEERLVDVYIYAADYAKEHKTVYLAKPNNGYHEIGLSRANIYGPFRSKVSEDGKLRLCEKQLVPPGAEVKVAYVYPAIAEARIPVGMSNPLLVLVPAKGEMSYRALVLDSSITDFPMGSYKLVNFSSRNVRGVIGRTLTKVSAWNITSFNPSKGNEDDRLQVRFQYEEEGRWFTFGSTTWANRTDKRTLLCAYISQDTGRMKIRGIPLK